jgi:hypothetical protein
MFLCGARGGSEPAPDRPAGPVGLGASYFLIIGFAAPAAPRGRRRNQV